MFISKVKEFHESIRVRSEVSAARSSYYTGRVTLRTMNSALSFKKIFAMIAAAFLVLLTLGAGLSHRSDAAIADLFCGNDLGLNTSWRPVFDFDRAASTRNTRSEEAHV